MADKTEKTEKFLKVLSSEETTVILNSIRYDIPRKEEVEVPPAVAKVLREAGYLADED